MYIDQILSSPAWKAMRDYHKGWYVELLLRSTRSEPLGYLPLDGRLWEIAGAHSRPMWEQHKGAVMACFKTRMIDGKEWIYNQKLLSVMEEQSSKFYRKKSPSISNSPTLSDVDLGKEVLKNNIDHNMAGRKLQLDCGLAGQDALLMTTDAVRAYMNVQQSGAEEAAMGLLSLWLRYNRDISGAFKVGIFKFFQSGMWQYPEKWQEMANGNQAAKEGPCRQHPGSGLTVNGNCYTCYIEQYGDNAKRAGAT